MNEHFRKWLDTDAVRPSADIESDWQAITQRTRVRAGLALLALVAAATLAVVAWPSGGEPMAPSHDHSIFFRDLSRPDLPALEIAWSEKQ